MNNQEKEKLKEKIKAAIKISSQKVREQKRALGQKMIISEGGVIKTVDP